jgi:RecA/RadA recombinase
MSDQIEQQLKTVFDAVLTQNFGNCIPPEPFVTSTSIPHLDALLGGGIGSSAPIMISSSPETGKSSVCMYLAGQFIKQHPNSIAVYIDTEATSSGTSDAQSSISKRIKSLGIPEHRFQYNSLMLDIPGIYELIKKYADTKKDLDAKIKASGKEEEIKLLIIIDSLAGCPCSKALVAEDPKEVIGLRARELSHNIDRIRPILAFSKISLILIDQVRANMQIQGQFAPAQEKTVGTWNNIKTSTSSNTLQHALKTWVYLSKKKELNPGDMGNVIGWILDVKTEKNKLTNSGYSVSLVFDKNLTLHKLWSEYLFLKEMTTSEKKYSGGDAKKLPYPLLVGTSGPYRYIDIVDPITKKSVGKSDSFFEKDLEKKYNSDEKFREVFDNAVKVSVYERINNYLLKMTVEEDDLSE